MPDEDPPAPEESPEEDGPSDSPSQEFEPARLGLRPLNALGADHQRRYDEAIVSEREVIAKPADDDRTMRKDIAEAVFAAIKWQVAIADIAFLTYGFWNGWEIPGSTISAWLGATVVQVIAVGVVITRSLFPSEKQSK
jgi:hypothetical protein